MFSSALFAFLHHAAAFALVAAVVVERVLSNGELTPANARRILGADRLYGIAAGAVLVIGLLRVSFFEKGPAYYWHSAPFIVKLTLFAMVGLLSIYPTIQFLKWRKPLQEGVLPIVPEATMQKIRTILLWELAGIAGILLCAALMARGIGFLG